MSSIVFLMNWTRWSENYKSKKILNDEKPELLIIIPKIFDLLNEHLVGPHLEN